MEDETEVIKKAIKKPVRKAEPTIKASDLLSSGCTMLNLATSGRIIGCHVKGHYVLFVGDSNSGKTWLALNAFAEAAINKNFDGYRFIYDNGENGALMSMERFFGKAVADRLEPPAVDADGDPVYSTTTSELYYHLDDAAKKKTPFIYVQDSMDVLDEEADIETFESRKDAHRKGTKAKGSYGMAKAKTNSMGIRRVLSHLRKTGSILIIISQTRDKVQSFGGVPGAKSRAGGHALKFYASTEIWFSVKKTLTKTIKGKSRQLGILSKVKVQRSRITGKSKTVDVPIYHSQGVDDVGACVDYLVEERHWKKTGGEENMDAGKITAPEFSTVALPREKLIQTIEGENREQELRSLVRSVWNEIESACEIKRKSRYK